MQTIDHARKKQNSDCVHTIIKLIVTTLVDILIIQNMRQAINMEVARFIYESWRLHGHPREITQQKSQKVAHLQAHRGLHTIEVIKFRIPMNVEHTFTCRKMLGCA